ncbi:penicillin-binding protein [Streptacidiphilus sp. PB12-B1b]|nr:penicillin-binding protein [Streptacidiphilus sp. PB12-B1b]
MLGASVLAGALVAGLGIPAVGAIGLGAKSAANDFNDIPNDLAIPTLAQSSTIYDADGGVIAKVFPQDEDRTSVPLDRIAPIMQNALIDIEDHRFYQHGAIDLEGTLRALTKNASAGATTQGGSTLTQQYVKNVFIYEAGNDPSKLAEATRQTTGRKIQELRYAIKLEETLSKQQILDDYLNITYFGEHTYGVEEAAELYFSVHASQLTLTQAALLAGLEQSPSAYDPMVYPATALQRRNVVLAAMATYGTITQAQAAKAEAAPLGLKPTLPQTGCITAGQDEGFFCTYVEDVILQDPAFGRTAAARQALWNTGGLQIHTTLNPRDQAAENKAVSDNVRASNRKAAAATTMVQPGTGDILAMAQSRPYGNGPDQTEINYNADANDNGGEGFPTGSVFKAITAATALEQGIPLSYTIDAPAVADYPEMTDCSGTVHPAVSGDMNDTSKAPGEINMVQAMAASVNTYFVPLEQKVGLCNVVHMAQSLGLSYAGSPNGLVPLAQVQALTLGVNALTPLQIADAYAAFANNGVFCNAVALTKVVDSTGRSLPVPQADCHRVMQKSTAAGVNTLLASVVSDEGTGATVGIPWSDAGKTGTTNDDDQAWFAGYTKQISDATVMSNPDNPNHSLDPWETIDGVYYPNAFGYLTSGPIWKQAMSASMAGMPDIRLDFAPKPGDAASGPSDGGTDGGTDKGSPGKGGGSKGGKHHGGGKGGH